MALMVSLTRGLPKKSDVPAVIGTQLHAQLTPTRRKVRREHGVVLKHERDVDALPILHVARNQSARSDPNVSITRPYLDTSPELNVGGSTAQHPGVEPMAAIGRLPCPVGSGLRRGWPEQRAPWCHRDVELPTVHSRPADEE